MILKNIFKTISILTIVFLILSVPALAFSFMHCADFWETYKECMKWMSIFIGSIITIYLLYGLLMLID